jgi:hypothetical protein
MASETVEKSVAAPEARSSDDILIGVEETEQMASGHKAWASSGADDFKPSEPHKHQLNPVVKELQVSGFRPIHKYQYLKSHTKLCGRL